MRLSLLAVAIFVLVLATASACDNEELDRLMEEAPPLGATVVYSEQCTSGTFAAPKCGTVWFRMDEPTVDIRAMAIIKHAESAGWRFVDRRSWNDEGPIDLFFERDGYNVKFHLVSSSQYRVPNCGPEYEPTDECLDHIYISQN